MHNPIQVPIENNPKPIANPPPKPTQPVAHPPSKPPVPVRQIPPVNRTNIRPQRPARIPNRPNPPKRPVVQARPKLENLIPEEGKIKEDIGGSEEVKKEKMEAIPPPPMKASFKPEGEVEGNEQEQSEAALNNVFGVSRQKNTTKKKPNRLKNLYAQPF